MSVSATTTLHTFFDMIKGQLATVLDESAGVAGSNIFVVDKLRLQNIGVPCLQLEPLALQPIAENSGMNVMTFEYRVHTVVKVEQDFGMGSEQALLAEDQTTSGAKARGAFALAVECVKALLGTKGNNGNETQVFIKLEQGGIQDLEGLTTASATFRTMIRLTNDG